MRKILFASIALLLFSMQAKAQKYFDVYQDGKVTTSIASTNVDSIGLTGTTMQDRKVNFYRNGNAVNSYLVSTVDSIKVFRTDEEQLVYLGVVGFNQELYEKPIDVLATSTSELYTSYVNNLSRKDGTLLYYAVDHALDMLKTASFPTPLTSVNLVTFTDGLDQGSLMMNSNYSTEEQYLNAVSSRIASTKVKGIPVTAYSLGLRGSDVSDYELFQKNLVKLASSSEKAFEVSNMGAVRTRLQEICDQIISISSRQTFSLKIPGQSNGTLIRFTFDGNTADNSELYIEGTFNLANRSLTNVTYHGIKATSGSFVQGTQDGIFVTFTFTGMQREDGNGLIPKEDIREYYQTSGSTTWQQNSEFTPNNNTQTTVTHSGAAIMLVLDCSSSLGSQFSDMKYYAQDFINRVAENTQEFTLEAPNNVVATLTDDLTVNVSWNAVKHAERYLIYRNSQESGTYNLVSPEMTTTSWTDTEPLQGSNYYLVAAFGHGLKALDWSEVANVDVTEWSSWKQFNTSGTAVYHYNGYWSGVDDSQKFEYRHNLITPNLYQFKIYNWGSGTELVFDYDEATGNVSCAPQFAVNNSTYGDVTVSDAAYYAGVRGWDDYAGGKPTGYFDKEQGIIACQMAYFVSAGYWAYGNYEYIYIDGYNRADLSTEAAYAGKFIDANGNSFVVANVTLGPDVEYANVALVEGKDVSEEVLQQIAEGTYQPLQQVTESGEVRFAADELADGKYTIVVVPFYEDEARVDNASTITFTFTASDETETWTVINVGDYLYGAKSYNQDGSFFYDDSPFTEQGTLYQSDKDGSRYKIAPWCNSEEDGLVFTMDEEGTITVEECPTGHTSSFGDILVSDFVTYGAADIKSYYENGVFHFCLVFHVPAGVFSYQEDTFTITDNAAKAKKNSVILKRKEFSSKGLQAHISLIRR